MRLLDLFCCEGGASMGYSRAGYTVYGVDLFEGVNRKRYPFPSAKADAIAVLDTLLEGGSIRFNNGEHLGLDEFDVIAASPPCQAYSITRSSHSIVHPELLTPVRARLRATGTDYVIENVPGAPMKTPITLCGTAFRLIAYDTDGQPLYLKRHRLFESNQFIMAKGRCRCAEFDRRAIGVGGVYGGGSQDRTHAKQVRRGGYTPNLATRAALMDITWMSRRGMSQAIPPAYTEFIGNQLNGVHSALPADRVS